MQNFWFSWWRCYNLWFSGLLHHVVWWLDTSLSEDHAALIFRVEENEGRMVPQIIGV
jgi:hypothetical protein